jgi:hypothetical protein
MSVTKVFRPIKGPISASFDQPRPLTANIKTHIHGAIDIAVPSGVPIMAPEPGSVFSFAITRSSNRVSPSELPKLDFMFDIQRHHYFYDIYGGVIVLLASSGRTHIITHSWRRQMFTRWRQAYRLNHDDAIIDMGVFESEREERFPAICGEYTAPVKVQGNEIIGYVGNAGFSTGPHIHWEIHPGRKWVKHDKRLNPEDFI